MYLHTREPDSHPGFDGVKIKFVCFIYYLFFRSARGPPGVFVRNAVWEEETGQFVDRDGRHVTTQSDRHPRHSRRYRPPRRWRRWWCHQCQERPAWRQGNRSEKTGDWLLLLMELHTHAHARMHAHTHKHMHERTNARTHERTNARTHTQTHILILITKMEIGNTFL